MQRIGGIEIIDRRLKMLAASNLGGDPKNIEDAIRTLIDNANETDEDGIVNEINFCIDLV